MTLSFDTFVKATNTGGVVAVLILAVWLGLRGDVVPSDQLRDCRMARDAYIAELLKLYRDLQIVPAPR